MWLERFGTVDERIFFAFVVVTGIILIITIANFFLTCCSGEFGPGHAVSFFFDISVVAVSASVLFRGVQTKWAPVNVYQTLCQVFTAEMLFGYTLFGAVLCVRSWAYVMVFRYNKKSPSWAHLVSINFLLLIASIATVIWELVFTPDIQFSMTSSNTTSPILRCQDPAQLIGSASNDVTDVFQFWWRVASSVYFAAILVVGLLALPFMFDIKLPTRLSFLRPHHVALLLIDINTLICIVIGLLIWFLWKPSYASDVIDSYQYAIIGGLQLWMLLFAQTSLLIAHIITAKATGICCGRGSIFPRYDSSGRLLNRELATFDSVDSLGSLPVNNLDLYNPSQPRDARYENVPPAVNDTNTRHFRY